MFGGAHDASARRHQSSRNARLKNTVFTKQACGSTAITKCRHQSSTSIARPYSPAGGVSALLERIARPTLPSALPPVDGKPTKVEGGFSLKAADSAGGCRYSSPAGWQAAGMTSS